MPKAVPEKPKSAVKRSPKKPRRATRRAKPLGRAEIREAVTKAAERLFLEQSPGTVSLREVAAQAGVSYSLVHRHFGTKEALLAEVFQVSVRRNEAYFEDAEDIRSMLRRVHKEHYQTGYARALAWAILEGLDLDVVLADPELINRYFERTIPRSTPLVSPRTNSDVDLRAIAAAFTCFLLGWDLYEPYLVRITGMEHADRGVLSEHLMRISDAILSLGPKAE
jgi:AcrR family transcriptional regulator